jgi:hypothetical protein
VIELSIIPNLVRRAATLPTPRRPLSEIGYAPRLEKIGYDAYYGGQGAYLYQPIPKNACTTIKTLLLKMAGLPVDENIWGRHQKEYNRFPGTNHLPLEKQLDIFEGRTNTFKFVIVRNPYARLASAYRDKILLNPAPYIIRNLRKTAAEHGIALFEPMTFAEFVSVICHQSLAEMNPHFRPQYYEGRFRIIKYDFIGRMETLPDDLMYAFERIGAPEWILTQVQERNNVSGSSLEVWESVPADVRRLFLAIFDIDFDILQYPHRLPSAELPRVSAGARSSH